MFTKLIVQIDIIYTSVDYTNIKIDYYNNLNILK